MPRDVWDHLRDLRIACDPHGPEPNARRARCSDCTREYLKWVDDRRNYCAFCGAKRGRRAAEESKAKARAAWLDHLRAELDAEESART